MDGPMPPEAIERLDADIQRVLRERYESVIPLVAAPKRSHLSRIGPRRAALPAAFRALTRDRAA